MLACTRRPVALALALLAAACTTSGKHATTATSATTPAAPPPPSATSASPKPHPSPTPTLTVKVLAPADGITGFRSPSGNIVCSMFAARSDSAAAVRCDVYEHTWKVPPKPADCDLDWGSIATLTAGRKATMGACASDAAGGGPALAYDHAIRVGTLQCASYRTGVECVQIGTTHGFFISKASYRLS